MNNFITALQFLTRIKIFKQNNWSDDAFSKSVPYFSLVGAIIGLALALVNHFLPYDLDNLLRAVILVAFEIYLTGGLLCDGLMDTADGVFSGRERSRMLEIMKDSHVGSNGIIFFVFLVIFKITLYSILPKKDLTNIIFAMPIITRGIMSFLIVNFKYARSEGIGGLFTKYAKKGYDFVSIIVAIACLGAVFSVKIYIAGLITFIYSLIIGKYIASKLGGLTGDTYGFIAETGNIVFIICMYFFFYMRFSF